MKADSNAFTGAKVAEEVGGFDWMEVKAVGRNLGKMSNINSDSFPLRKEHRTTAIEGRAKFLALDMAVMMKKHLTIVIKLGKF